LFIVACADDVLLITQSVVEFQRLVHMCEIGLEWLDTEADLGMFSVFGRTGTPTKRGLHKSTILCGALAS